jgi:hypothetical protein
LNHGVTGALWMKFLLLPLNTQFLESIPGKSCQEGILLIDLPLSLGNEGQRIQFTARPQSISDFHCCTFIGPRCHLKFGGFFFFNIFLSSFQISQFIRCLPSIHIPSSIIQISFLEFSPSLSSSCVVEETGFLPCIFNKGALFNSS